MIKKICLFLGLAAFTLSFFSCVEELHIKDEAEKFQVDHSFALPIIKNKKILIKDLLKKSKLGKIPTDAAKLENLLNKLEQYASKNKSLATNGKVKGISKKLKGFELDEESVKKSFVQLNVYNNSPLAGTLTLVLLNAQARPIKMGRSFEYKVDAGASKNPAKQEIKLILTPDQWKKLKKADSLYWSFALDLTTAKTSLKKVSIEKDHIILDLGVFLHYNTVVNRKMIKE